MVGKIRESWWEEGKHFMRANVVQPDMMQWMVDRSRAPQLRKDTVIDFSWRDMNDDIAGWRVRQRRRRKRYEITPGGREERAEADDVLVRKSASQPWLRRDMKRRGKSLILSEVQTISHGGRMMYFVPLMRWM